MTTDTIKALRQALEHIKGAAMDLTVDRRAIAAAADEALSAATQEAREPVAWLSTHKLGNKVLNFEPMKNDYWIDTPLVAAPPAQQADTTAAPAVPSERDATFEQWFKSHYIKHGFITSKAEAQEIWSAARSLCRTAPDVPEERDAFESWIRQKGWPSHMLHTDVSGEYQNGHMQQRWEAWQASALLDRAIKNSVSKASSGTSYEACGSCGEKDPSKRCIGCGHVFIAAAPTAQHSAAPGEGN